MDAEVREYKSQHDAIAELPLVTERARITEVERMDRDRREEVRDAVAGWLADHAVDVGDPVAERERLREQLADAGEADLARRVAAVTERAARPKPMLVRATFQPKAGFDYLAGQYVGLRYDGTSRAYSIASSPTREDVEICVRRVPDGRLSPRLCGDLAVGDELTVRGPHGDLVLQDHSARDVVFLATGTGVAPFKGMIDYVFEEAWDRHEGRDRDVWLFVGAAWHDDIPYRESFRELAAEHDNFHFVPTLSREPYLTDWDGETDYVQHALLKHVDPTTVTEAVGNRVDTWLRREPDSGVEARIDPANADVYACGINAMVYALVEAVESVGVPAERIESEGFG